MKPRVLVIGGSFAGLNAAFALKRALKNAAEVTVLDQHDRFVFIPSMIWLVPGWRSPDDISFPLAPVLERKGIRFVEAEGERVDPVAKTVITRETTLQYRLPAHRDRIAVELRRDSRARAARRLHPFGRIGGRGGRGGAGLAGAPGRAWAGGDGHGAWRELLRRRVPS